MQVEEVARDDDHHARRIELVPCDIEHAAARGEILLRPEQVSRGILQREMRKVAECDTCDVASWGSRGAPNGS
jgi:hypothetical protein